MKVLIILIGLTIFYYAILLMLNHRKKKAFLDNQKSILAPTAPLPINATTADLFGATASLQKTTSPKIIKEKEPLVVDEGLDELLSELEEKQIPPNDLEAQLKAAADITSITETETAEFVKSVSRKPKI